MGRRGRWACRACARLGVLGAGAAGAWALGRRRQQRAGVERARQAGMRGARAWRAGGMGAGRHGHRRAERWRARGRAAGRAAGALGARGTAGRCSRRGRAAWAPGLALGSALGALGPFSIRFDSFFFLSHQMNTVHCKIKFFFEKKNIIIIFIKFK